MTTQNEAAINTAAYIRGYEEGKFVAAVELRRLDEELRCEERRFEELSDDYAAAAKRIAELEAALQNMADFYYKSTQYQDKARAAIAKHGGQQ